MALVDNIVAFWKFDESAPTDYSSAQLCYADATGRGNTLVVEPEVRVKAFTSVPFRMAANADNNQQLDGSLAGWGKWIRTLTSGEKTALMGGEMWPFNTTPSLKNGLVAYYLLNEASNSSTYADSTGRGNTLTRTGTTTQVTGPLGVGHGTEFTSGAYIEASPIPKDLQTGDSDFTIFGWFNMNSKPGAGESVFFGQASLGTHDPIGAVVYYQGTSFTDSINIDVGDGTDLFTLGTLTIPSSSPTVSTWYPVLFEYVKASSIISGIFNSGSPSTWPRNIQPAAVTGKIGNGAQFSLVPVYNGVGVNNGWGDQVIVRGTAPANADVSFGNNNKTAWFWFKSANTSATQSLAGFYDAATSDLDWLVQIAGGTLYFLMGNNSGTFQFCDVAFTDTSSFHLLVVWYNQLTNTIHLDLDHGASTALLLLTSVTPSTPTNPFFVGCNQNGLRSAGSIGASNQFLGIIDEMGIANGIPISTDLDTLWNGGAGWANSFPTFETDDVVTLTDATTEILTPNPINTSLSDSITITDSTSEILFPSIFDVLLHDSFVLTDSIITHLIKTQIQTRLTDSLTLFDLLTTSYYNRLTLTDFISTFHDGILTDTGKAPMGLGDFFNFSDTVKQSLATFAPFHDSITITDSIQTTLNTEGTPLVDSFSITDSIQTRLSIQLSIQLSDSLVLTDAIDQIPSTSFGSYIRRYLNDVP